VVALARAADVPVVAVVGDADPDVVVPPGVEVVSLVARFGEDRARQDTAGCLGEAVAILLAERGGGAPN